MAGVNSLLRLAAGRNLRQISQRAFATSIVSRAELTQLSQADKDKYYPKLGNRDIVGHGFNGMPMYWDRPEYPGVAVRFKENTPEILALRDREKGDWKALSLEDKKILYRASFCQTYAEMEAPTGLWRNVLGWIFIGLSAVGCMYIGIRKNILDRIAKPRTINREWQEAELENMVREGQGPVDGISSKWDFEKGAWK